MYEKYYVTSVEHYTYNRKEDVDIILTDHLK